MAVIDHIPFFIYAFLFECSYQPFKFSEIIDDVKPIFDKSSIKFIKSDLFIFHFFVQNHLIVYSYEKILSAYRLANL